jgi:hypothetical protein
MRFDPQQLTAAASLNRLRVEMDGAKIPPEITGKSGFELCSGKALAGIIRRRAGALGFEHGITADDRELIRRFDDCLTTAAPNTHAAAMVVVRELARNMAFIVLTARRRSQAANLDEWDRGYWQHWQKITTIVFGGGIVAGNVGREFAKAVCEQWAQLGLPSVNFLVDPRAGRITIDGLASALKDRKGQFLLFDFGGSFVKRGLAEPSSGTMPIVQQLEKVSVPPEVANPSDDAAGGKSVLEFMVQTIVATWLQYQVPVTILPVGLAAYLVDGHPCVQGGGYTAMHHVTENVQTNLSQEIGRRINQDVNVRLVHDGTAAAMKYCGSQNLAVIMMGTALGVGFAPESALAP